MKKTQSPLNIKIGKIWSGSEGTTEKLTIDTPVEFPPEDIQPVSNLQAEVMLIKMRKEITVLIKTLELTVRRTCEKCLKEFDSVVQLKNLERQFMEKQPKDEADFADIMLIDMEHMSIDLSEMVRQEIILHFPFIAVCSKGCTGLCGICGQNLNQKKCGCQPKEDHLQQKPFHNLKNLLS